MRRLSWTLWHYQQVPSAIIVRRLDTEEQSERSFPLVFAGESLNRSCCAVRDFTIDTRVFA